VAEAREVERLGAPNHLRFCTIGTALYRDGQYEESLRYLQGGLLVDTQQQQCVSSYVFLAMAHHHLGQADEAAADFAKAVEIAKRAPVQDHETKGLLAEARALLEPGDRD
jgi:tetratricopeptide (TPR) repeat protein